MAPVNVHVRLLSCLLLGLLWPPPLPAGAASLSLTARAVDPQGAPLPAATLELYELPSRAEDLAADLGLHLPDEPLAQAKADPRGRLTVQAPAPGVYQVRVLAPGRLTVIVALPALTEAADLGRVVLEPALPWRVRVVDTEGRPVQGVRVRLGRPVEERQQRLVASRSVAPRSAWTDARGEALLPRARDENGTLWVRPAVGVPVDFPLGPVTADGVELRLPAVALRAVRVETPAGQPAAGVFAAQPGVPLPLAVSGPRGELLLPEGSALPAPTQPVWLLAADGRGRAELAAAELTSTPGGKGPVLTRRLTAVPRLRGVVRDAVTGAPLAGAWVWRLVDPGAAVGTDPAGRFELPDATPWLSLLAAAPGYALATPTGQAAGTATPAGLEIRLQPAARISGQVTDGDGRPLAEVEVTARTQAIGEPVRYAVSDAAGQFTFSPLGAGRPYEIVVDHETGPAADTGTARLELTPLAAGEHRTGVRLVLTQSRVTLGQVLDDTGNPLPGAEVRLVRREDQRPRRVEQAALGLPPGDPLGTTGADGRFRIAPVPPGEYDLLADGPGVTPLRVPRVAVPAGRGEHDLGTLRLAAAIVLSGRVVDPDGRPVAGARVAVWSAAITESLVHPGPTNPFEVTTGPDGRFAVAELARGAPTGVRVTKTGFVRREIPLRELPLAEPLEIVLTAGAALAGRVVDPSGQPVAGARVRVERAPGEPGEGRGQHAADRAESDAEGHFEFSDLPPGRVSLVAGAPDWFESLPISHELRSGEVTDGGRLELRPAGVIAGQVRTLEGEPVPEVSVYLTSRGLPGQGATSDTTDAEGRFRLRGVPFGDHVVTARGPDLLETSAAVTVGPGEQRLDLRLGGGQDVRGQVRDARGTVAGASVLLHSEQAHQAGRFRMASTAEDGRFRLRSVVPGRYRLQVQTKDRMVPWPEVIEVAAAGSPADLVIQLPTGARLVGRLHGLSLGELERVQVMAFPAANPRPNGLNDLRAGRAAFDGRFQLLDLQPGVWQVVAQLETRRATATVEIPEGTGASAGDLAVELTFTPGVALRARVVRDAAPAVGVMVVAQAEGVGEAAASGGMAPTDVSGQAVLTNLPPGVYQVFAMLPGSAPGPGERVEIHEDTEITLELVTGEVSGRVLALGEGAPLGGAEVRLTPLMGLGGFPVVARTQSDAQGFYRFAAVSPGRFSLSAQTPGYAQSEDAEDEVEMPAAGGEVRRDLVLAPSAALTLLLTEGGVPLPVGTFVAVLARPAGDAPDPSDAPLRTLHGTTLDRGRLALDGLGPGLWSLWCHSPSSAWTRLEVNLPGPERAVELLPGASLTLTVAPPEVGGEARGQVALYDAAGRPFTAPAGTSAPRLTTHRPLYLGRLDLPAVPPGRWRVEVTLEDGRRWSRELELPVGITRVSFP